MKKKFFWLTAVLIAVFLSGCNQKIDSSAKLTPPPSPSIELKVTVTQPANGNIQVTPALPSNGMVENGKELTFTLSANTGFKVKTLTINGKTYSNITDKRITKKIKIEKNTEVSGAVEEDTENPPIPGTKYKVTITQPANGKIEVTPALPSDGMVTKGSELTFTLSANTGYKVKTLTINGKTYSGITDNRITQTVKIEKDTAISGAVEAETNPTQPNSDYENKNNGSSVKIVKQNNGQGAALTGNIYIDDLISNDFKEKLKDITGNIETSNLKINCFKPKTISGQ